MVFSMSLTNWRKRSPVQIRISKGMEVDLAEAIAPGVWWLHRTRGCNVFLAETASHGLILFDTGFSSSLPGILEEVEALRPGARITHLFLTHHHADHAGTAAVLRGHYGALVVAGAADCRQDDRGRFLLRTQIGTSHRRRRILRRFLASGGPATEVVVDRPLSGEGEIAGILAIPTPGHTLGSYCYLLSDRDVAIVGDLVISHRTGLVRPMKAANHDDEQYLHTLSMFASRAPNIGCPGHGAVVSGGFQGQLTALASLQRRSLISPAGAWTRGRRMWQFARGMTRERRP